MKRLNTRRSAIGIIGKAVITASLLSCAAVPQYAHAAPTPDAVTSGVYVTILSPSVDLADPTKQIEVSAFYQAAPVTGGVTTLELYIDGQQEAVKKLDAPENRGVVSFVIGPGTLSPGSHRVVVTVSASDAEVASAKTGLNIAQPITDDSSDSTPVPALGGDTADGSAPAIAIMAPLPDSTVVGTVDIKVDAHDDSGKSPYVSLFIDHNFKTLRNFPPYDFAWDTTRVANGYHTLEVWGYNDQQSVGHAEPLTVYVNNPSGRTMVRQDLLDTVPAKLIVKPVNQPAAIPIRPRLAAKESASLAIGHPASMGLTNGLAMARVDFNSGSISEQTQLMAPFLPVALPQIVRHAPVAPAAAPSLAEQTASFTSRTSSMLAAMSNDDTAIQGSSELALPTVSEAVPAAMKTAPTVTEGTSGAFKTAVLTSPEAPSIDNTVQAQQISAVRLDSLTAPTVSDDEDGPALENPGLDQTPVSTPAALAAGKPIGAIMLGDTKIASASIDGSTLFTAGSDLQAPVVSANRIANVIATHTVQTHIVPLGATSAGFSPYRVLSHNRAYQVVLNNKLVMLDQPLEDRDSFLFAPFRQIFENEGGIMAWNPTLHQVHALNGSRDIELTIGSKTAVVNQEDITMNACPYLVRGHTMIPLAFVPIALDASVSYDPGTGHIVIESNN